MLSNIDLKRVSLSICIILLLILSIIGYLGYRNNWNFNLFFEEKVIDLEGEIETPDGNLVLKPKKMMLYHYRLIIFIDYELNPDLDDLDLKLQHVP
ncbi:hypothetical protein [Natranaerobius trueperi]|uniref:Uncharacterized protein n=1 Tax=Natranaerobius trueperi TaxID=759412 RepID=A0A226BWQ7_9FIRM|nr:hypothetical protein [Natranaerobius trueperi]OWZ83212.1 hypothetical protein CDO51_09955 [Natranaerobius trueperi]